MGGIKKRRGTGVVWHLIGKAQLSNDSAGQKFCLQDHVAKLADTSAWCGTMWPDTSPGSAGTQHKPIKESGPKNLVTKEARKFLESLLRRLNLAYAD